MRTCKKQKIIIQIYTGNEYLMFDIFSFKLKGIFGKTYQKWNKIK